MSLKWRFVRNRWECWRDTSASPQPQHVASVQLVRRGQVEVHCLNLSSNKWDRTTPQRTVHSAKAVVVRKYDIP